MKAYSLLILLFFCELLSAQSFFVRYNQAGYKVTAPKSLIICSKIDLKNVEWQIKKDENLISSGVLANSETGTGNHTNFEYNYNISFSTITEPGDYTFTIKDQKHQFSISSQPYQKFLPEILRYIRQQRSASPKSIDKPAGHYGDSIAPLYLQQGKELKWLKSETNEVANAQGGWYDAGDYLKFTLTNAYTTYLLLRAYEANPQAFQFKKHSTSELNDLLDEAKWGLDYLSSCLVSDSIFIIQVGDNRDHELGNRLPNQDTNPHRYAYSSLSRPQLAYCSAAFAIASKVYGSTDSVLGKEYLQKAEQFYALASKHKGCYWFQKDHEIFYADKNGYDNIMIAAAELYKTTGKQKYKDENKYYCTMAGVGYWASWADFNMVTHARSVNINSRSKNYLETDLNGFSKKANEENNIWNLPHEYTWGSLYSFFNVAYSSLLHTELYGPSKYDQIPYDVIDYTFGKNNWGYSFVASENLANSVQNIYSQTYILQPHLFPTGAIAEGPGDKKSHLEMLRWYNMSAESSKMEEFNTSEVIFYDDNSNFQTMETTICGLADGLFLLSLLSK